MSANTDKYFWYLSSLTTIQVSAQAGEDQLSVIEQRAAVNYSPPLHLHREQDEIMQVLEGEFRFKLGETEQPLQSGGIVLVPKNTPHTFQILSPNGGRWLLISVGTDFENFVRAAARPAERLEIPPTGEENTPENLLTLTITAAQFGIEIVGPSLR